jgi:hypothetical protein
LGPDQLTKLCVAPICCIRQTQLFQNIAQLTNRNNAKTPLKYFKALCCACAHSLTHKEFELLELHPSVRYLLLDHLIITSIITTSSDW